MIQFVSQLLRPLLFLPPVRRVRRNHGLEHATIHIMSKRVRHISMAGRAVVDGFFVYGNVETEDLLKAAREAIERMRKGEHILAIHPNCGTGLVTAGFLTSVATTLATLGTGGSIFGRLKRIPHMVVFAMAALLVSQPASLRLQQYITTLGDPGNLEIVDITRQQFRLPFQKSPVIVHKVHTRLG